MADFPDIEPDLEEIGLIANNQVYDSILTGEVQTASLSGAKWTCAPTFSNRNGKEARDLRAFIFGQNGVSGRFNYYPASIDNAGTHAGLGVVDGAGQTGSSLDTKDWDADQSVLFAAGDYLTVNGEMKMVTADVSVGQDYIEYDEANYMPSPFDTDGWQGANDSDVSYTKILESNPSGANHVGQFEYIGLGNQIPVLNLTPYEIFNAGEYFTSVCVKPIVGLNSGIVARFRTDSGFTEKRYNMVTTAASDPTNTKITELEGGYVLIQFRDEYLVDDGDFRLELYFRGLSDDASSTETLSVGDTIHCQAAFFGKTNDWPAKLRANATIPITPPMRTSPADGALIEANNPYFQGRLESDDMSRLQVSSPVIYNTTLSIVEAF